jgi:hypothetical protein
MVYGSSYADGIRGDFIFSSVLRMVSGFLDKYLSFAFIPVIRYLGISQVFCFGDILNISLIWFYSFLFGYMKMIRRKTDQIEKSKNHAFGQFLFNLVYYNFVHL